MPHKLGDMYSFRETSPPVPWVQPLPGLHSPRVCPYSLMQEEFGGISCTDEKALGSHRGLQLLIAYSLQEAYKEIEC